MTREKYNFLASIDIDAQQCFTPLCPDELPVEGGDEISDELNNQAEYAKFRIGSKDAHSRDAKWVAPVKERIFTAIEPDSDYKSINTDVYWPMHAEPGTKGFELIPGLPRPSEYDFFVWKGIELDMHPYGACYHDLAGKLSTGLIEFLKSHQITHIVAGGLSLDYCVKITVLQLAKAGFQVIVNLGATRGFAKETTVIAMQEMQKKGVVFIHNSQELEEVLG